MECFIVKRGNEFLVAVPYTDTLCIRWSVSKYDAVRIHRRSIARKIADRVGGEVVSFNTLTGVVS